MDRTRLTVLTLTLLTSLVASVPARTDPACQDALNTIAKATDTLRQMQEWNAALQKRQQEARAVAVTTPPAPAGQGAFIAIDIQPQANYALVKALHDTEGNNLKNVPQGEQTLAGVTFRIGPKMIRVRGAHARDMPEKVEGIPIGTAVGRLHLLHGTGYNLDEGTEIGAYIVHYADGATQRIPIVYGQDIRDWWGTPDQQNLKRARIAWSGTNPAADGDQMVLHLYSLVWANPHPDKPIRSLDFVSRNTECDPFLIALSIEKP